MNATTTSMTNPSPVLGSTSSTIGPIERIAHPTDLSAECDSAYYHALRLAAACGAHLDLVHVDREAHVMGPDHFPSPEATLAEWGLDRDSQPAEVCNIATYGTEPVGPIVDYLDDQQPDLLVLATHRRQGLARLLRREVAGKITRNRPVPTLFVPVGEEGFVSATTGRLSLRRILLPLAWEPGGQPAVDATLELADRLSAWPLELILLHVGDRKSDFPAVDLPRRDDLRLRWNRFEGEVAAGIVQQTEQLDADLVVMVTDGRHGLLDTLRGSTTEQVLQQLHCPLLVVPNPIPESLR